jgi:hypothetical protein
MALLYYCREKSRKDIHESNKQKCQEEAKAIIGKNITAVLADNPYGNNHVRRWRKCVAVQEEIV